MSSTVSAGTGVRAYYVKIFDFEALLFCGEDKSSQTRDIARARKLGRVIGLG